MTKAGLNEEEFHWHTLCFLLVAHGDLVEAEAELEGALSAARRAGDKSLELPTVVRYPFYWICLWPLIAVRTADGRLDLAVVTARDLVLPPQMRLPDELEVSVESAPSARESADRPATAERLEQALAVAEKLGSL